MFLKIIIAFGIFVFLGCGNASNIDQHAKKEVVYSADLKEAMELLQTRPDSVGLRFKVAVGLDSAGDFKGALLQMDSLILKDSMNYAFQFTKATIALDATDTSLAIKHFEKALKIYADPQGMLALANIYAEQRKIQSLKLVDRVRKSSVDRNVIANCDFIAGVYYARTGNVERSLSSLNNSLSNDYTNMPVYIEKGLLFFDRKDYREALSVFQQAANINHLYPDAYYYIGRCYELMGIKDSAITNFKQSLRLDPSIKESDEALARLNAK